MDKREKIETTIKLLESVEIMVQRGQELLHGVLGEMDAERDFARITRRKFKVVEGGKAKKKSTASAVEIKNKGSTKK